MVSIKLIDYSEWSSYYESKGDEYDLKQAILESNQLILEQSLSKKTVASLIEKIKKSDSDKVKQAKGWDDMMSWFEAEGPTGKVTRTSGKKKGTSYKPEFTGNKETLVKSLTYWSGDLGGKVTAGKNTKPPRLLKGWLDLAEGEIYSKWLKAAKKYKGDKPYHSDLVRFTSAVPESEVRDYLQKCMDSMNDNIKNGRALRSGIKGKTQGVRYGCSTEPSDNFNFKDDSKYTYLGAGPYNVEVSDKLETYDLKRITKWLNSYFGKPSNVRTEEDGKKVRNEDGKYLITEEGKANAANKRKGTLDALKGTKYFTQKAVGITDFDKRKMLSTIVSASEKRGISITLAKNIVIKPSNAVTKEKTEKVPGESKSFVTFDNFSFPNTSDPVKFARESMVMYAADSNTANQGMKEKLKAALISEINKIKEDGGKILSFNAQIVSSTSVIPSRYLGNGKIGTTRQYSYDNNITLAKDRALDMKGKLNAALADPVISKMLEGITANIQITETPNNPGTVESGGFATKEDAIKFYEDLKKKNGGRASGDPNWKTIRAKKYAPQRHSGIAFQAKVKYTETVETEREITTEEVIGDWIIKIYFPRTSSYKKKRSSGSGGKKWRIDWFPKGGRPGGGGHSVKDLCAAYG